VQDPELFLNELNIAVNDFLNPDRPAIISAEYRVTVGFETYFFADSSGVIEFADNVTQYCGPLTDPVTKERFQPDDSSPISEYNGLMYIFSSKSNQSMFEAMPDMYRFPDHKMLPRDSIATNS